MSQTILAVYREEMNEQVVPIRYRKSDANKKAIMKAKQKVTIGRSNALQLEGYFPLGEVYPNKG